MGISKSTRQSLLCAIANSLKQRATSGITRSANTYTRPRANNIYRRMARRGGVKRISATIYHEARETLKEYLGRVRVAQLSSLTI